MVSIDPTLPRWLPADADGATLPPANAPEPIITDNDDGAGFPQDRIDVWNATMTWARPRPSASCGGLPPDRGVRSEHRLFRTVHPPQPGTAVRVDALPNRPMYRLAYRNFGSHQALAFNHTVDGDGANRAGVHGTS